MLSRTAGDGMESDKTVTEAPRPSNNENKKTEKLPGRIIMCHPFPDELLKKLPQYQTKTNFANVQKDPIPSKNNLDLNTLVSQMSLMDNRPSEFKPQARSHSIVELAPVVTEPPIEQIEMEKEIEKLRNENELLKVQLTQQVQVNKELKTMLVASMGEDLETQVQTLNEDKKHLATALTNSAQHLSTHQEQTEWLAGQCEVWRSKFLASSLMVEELANWKKILNERTQHLELGIKQLLDERNRTREMMLHTYKNLSILHDRWLKSIIIDEDRINNQSIGNALAAKPVSSNVIDLAHVNLKISENITDPSVKPDISSVASLPSQTDGERHVESIISQPLGVRNVQEVPINALVQHAYVSGNSSAKPVASCFHCNGQVQLL